MRGEENRLEERRGEERREEERRGNERREEERSEPLVERDLSVRKERRHGAVRFEAAFSRVPDAARLSSLCRYLGKRNIYRRKKRDFHLH